jgi:hypothetical protein
MQGVESPPSAVRWYVWYHQQQPREKLGQPSVQNVMHVRTQQENNMSNGAISGSREQNFITEKLESQKFSNFTTNLVRFLCTLLVFKG